GTSAAALPAADVLIARGDKSALDSDGKTLRVTLADAGASGGTRTYVRLEFAEGKLSASLRSADGASLAEATLTHACAIPKSKEEAVAHHGQDGEADETSSGDAEAASSECDQP